MIKRTKECLGLHPKRLAADTAYGTGKFLSWLIGAGIQPQIPVWDMSQREDGTFSRADFTFDKDRNVYVCPAGNLLTTTGTVHDGRPFFTARACVTAAHVQSSPSAARIPRNAKSPATSMKIPATTLAR